MASPDEFAATASRIILLAQGLAERHAGHPMYPQIVRWVAEAKQISDLQRRHELVWPLGVLAARELDGPSVPGGEYQDLADAIFHLCSVAWEAAGRPP